MSSNPTLDYIEHLDRHYTRNVKGVSFHIGENDGCRDNGRGAYYKIIKVTAYNEKLGSRSFNVSKTDYYNLYPSVRAGIIEKFNL